MIAIGLRLFRISTVCILTRSSVACLDYELTELKGHVKIIM